MTKVSVIVPVYNKEDVLIECLDSITSQTLNDIEVICVNDGSTDNSLNILKEYASKDSRIVVIDKQNAGAAVARNSALDIAKGEFIAFMDSDDLYPSDNVLEILYNKAVENNVSICGGEMYSMGETPDDKYKIFYEGACGYYFENDGIVEYKDYQYDYGFTRFIYKKSLIDEYNLRFPLLRWFEDPPFFVSIMDKAKRFYAVSMGTYLYRVSYNTIKNEKVALDFLNGIIYNIKFAQKHKYKKLYRYSLLRVIHTKYFIKVKSWRLLLTYVKLFLSEPALLLMLKELRPLQRKIRLTLFVLFYVLYQNIK